MDFGSHHHPNFVLDVQRQAARVGQRIILFLAPPTATGRRTSPAQMYVLSDFDAGEPRLVGGGAALRVRRRGPSIPGLGGQIACGPTGAVTRCSTKYALLGQAELAPACGPRGRSPACHPRAGAACPARRCGIRGHEPLWAGRIPAPIARRLRAGGVLTVGDLISSSAGDLEHLGLRPPQINEVRLVLYRKGLALHGEVVSDAA